MKKIVYLTVFAVLCVLAGCSNNSAMTDYSNGREEREFEDNSISSDSKAAIDFVTATSEITELESGLSIVRYDGDYGLDRFLEQGGAGSDKEVMQFLVSTLFSGNINLQMDSAAFGCSTISVPNTEGGYFFGRNFDWQTCDALIVLAYPEKGYSSISTVNLNFIRQGAGALSNFLEGEIVTVAALYAPLDGMNEKGLSVSVNMIQDSADIQQDTDKPDITTTTAIRLLLDQASDVGEALELLAQYDLHASMDYMVHFAIADSDGRSVAVEYVGNEMIVTETPILTNFYVAEGEKYGIGTQQSHTRFDILEKSLEENSQMTLPQVRDTLDNVSKDNFGEFESTEWSIIFDQTALTATYYHRENYQIGYAVQIPLSVQGQQNVDQMDVKQQENSEDDKEDSIVENIEIMIGDVIYSAQLYDNEAAQAFAAKLPFTFDMSELNGNEKYYYMAESLPTDSGIPNGIHTGDLMLYGSNCLVLFYEDFSTSYSYTPLGYIEKPDELAKVLGNGAVQVTFQKSPS